MTVIKSLLAKEAVRLFGAVAVAVAGILAVSGAITPQQFIAAAAGAIFTTVSRQFVTSQSTVESNQPDKPAAG